MGNPSTLSKLDYLLSFGLIAAKGTTFIKIVKSFVHKCHLKMAFELHNRLVVMLILTSNYIVDVESSALRK